MPPPKVTVTGPVAAAAAGMNAETLRVWRSRGYFLPGHGPRGGWSRFSLCDTVRLAVAVELAEMFSPDLATFFSAIVPDEPSSGLLLVVANFGGKPVVPDGMSEFLASDLRDDCAERVWRHVIVPREALHTCLTPNVQKLVVVNIDKVVSRVMTFLDAER